MAEQNFANHGTFVPPFHFFVVPALIINSAYALYAWGKLGFSPSDLRARIGEFSVDQCVALRFASDAESPHVVRKVLDDKVTERKAIKQMVRNWKLDYLRA